MSYDAWKLKNDRDDIGPWDEREPEYDGPGEPAPLTVKEASDAASYASMLYESHERLRHEVAALEQQLAERTKEAQAWKGLADLRLQECELARHKVIVCGVAASPTQCSLYRALSALVAFAEGLELSDSSIATARAALAAADRGSK